MIAGVGNTLDPTGMRAGRSAKPVQADALLPSADVNNRPYQIGRPDEADWSAEQRIARRIAAIRQCHHVMAEMREHPGEIKTGDPFPSIMTLLRSACPWHGK